ncbi:MFS transporter [Haloglycomyces albus]|uniref:MFS transporter n=1 Tax=Haloglycomyces albus TaxID=526067 RepID=UPI0012EC7E63|nr:MFS transporter [Haloglycomyces albus]
MRPTWPSFALAALLLVLLVFVPLAAAKAFTFSDESTSASPQETRYVSFTQDIMDGPESSLVLPPENTLPENTQPRYSDTSKQGRTYQFSPINDTGQDGEGWNDSENPYLQQQQQQNDDEEETPPPNDGDDGTTDPNEDDEPTPQEEESPGDEDGSDVTPQQTNSCTDWEWHNEWFNCIDNLPDAPEVECAEEPTPSSPDSGMAGWFAEPTLDSDKDEGIGMYTSYGYAGYQLPMYGSKAPSVAGSCVDALSLPNGADSANAVANLQFNLATATTGASNSMRQYAWEPGTMWSWSDEFLETGTNAVYTRVFSVFGAITLAIVGLYLLWRSRQAEMSNAVTTASWAALIMVLVIAVAQWPTQASGWADKGLTMGLNVSTNMLPDEGAEGCIEAPGADQDEYEEIKEYNPDDCIDTRGGAVKASDMVVDKVLYENWLRAMLGQGTEFTPTDDEDEDGNPVVTDANTAYKYGPALYWAQALTWNENERAEEDPANRAEIFEEKQKTWRNLAAQIEREDPEAHAALVGERAWERAGTALLALVTALFFSLFDLTSSLLIILGFMVVRFAIIALPIIGTVALLRPAGGPFKRLVNIVLASIINVMVFAVAAVVYLYAASLILGANLPSWLQIVLIGLVGVSAWMLLRPFRRLASMQGSQSATDSLLARNDSNNERDSNARKQTQSIQDTNTNISQMRREQAQRRPETRPDTGSVSDQASTPRQEAHGGYAPGQQPVQSFGGDVYRPGGGR